MNWLAHTLLSTKKIDYQLGNILADPLRGRAWTGASEALINGMNMHKAIDQFTDNHPILSSSKTKLGADGHLKGVVLDLLFDHLLSQSWEQYAALSLDAYLKNFNNKALKVAVDFPERPQKIVSRMAQTDLLGQYKTFNDLIAALGRIDRRLSARARAKETASQYITVLTEQYEPLKSDFNVFFPELIHFFKHHQLGSLTDHFLK